MILCAVISCHAFFFFFNNNCIVPLVFLPWEIHIAFSGESRLRQSRSTQPTVNAERFSVSIILRTLTWITGSLTRLQLLLLHAIAHEGCTDTVRESALKADSGRKIPCRTGESNLPQRRAGSTLTN